jgi:hypothetical protein
MSFIRRIRECQVAQPRSNCIGTALFIAGIKREDSVEVCSYANRQFLQDLKRLDTPIPGALVAWVRESTKKRVLVRHMGVIASVEDNNLLITHRAGRCGLVIENEQIDTIETMCGYNHSLVVANPKTYKERYYLPPILR